MKVVVKARPGHTLARVEGDVTHADVRQFMAALDELVDRDVRRLILDLSDVPYVTSRALGAVVGAYTVLARRGGAMVLVTAQPEVLAALAMTKLDAIVPVAATLEEALERLPPLPPEARMA